VTHRVRDQPLVVLQRDHQLLVRTADDRWPHARDLVRPFAELARLGGGLATFRITPLSLWNAAAAGLSAQGIEAALRDLSGAPIPPATVAFIHETLARSRLIRLTETDSGPALVCTDPALLRTLCERANLPLPPPRQDTVGHGVVLMPLDLRGSVKLAFASLGYPVLDDLGVARGEQVSFALRPDAPALRPYQGDAVTAFARSHGGGLVLLPCGAGKTLVGVAAAARLGARTLVLCPGRTNAYQWERAFRSWTDLPADAVGVFDGAKRALYPVTGSRPIRRSRRGVGERTCRGISARSSRQTGGSSSMTRRICCPRTGSGSARARRCRRGGASA